MAKSLDFLKMSFQYDGSIVLEDHLGGFDQDFFNPILDQVVTYALDNNISDITTSYILNDQVKTRYPGINFYFDIAQIGAFGWETMNRYNTHPEIKYETFISSFNGSGHVSRKLLVACLNKFGWFDPKYNSKNFIYSNDEIDGHIKDYVPYQESFYRKFFIDYSDDFHEQIYTLGPWNKVDKFKLYIVEFLNTVTTRSFLHIVSETMATNYHPWVTEKALYGIITRGLFLAYAQPNYHAEFETHFGFKKYDKLFDYSFDKIRNPVERLLNLLSMICKFSKLSKTDWYDLYEMEKHTIEYNYDHYFSKDYLKFLKKYQKN